jgi:hypothetical protein
VQESTQATETTEVTLETQEEQPTEQDQRYQLLNHLMKFVKQQTRSLNPVLAGYFSKLLTLLL